jgi:hypothetical protein
MKRRFLVAVSSLSVLSLPRYCPTLVLAIYTRSTLLVAYTRVFVDPLLHRRLSSSFTSCSAAARAFSRRSPLRLPPGPSPLPPRTLLCFPSSSICPPLPLTSTFVVPPVVHLALPDEQHQDEDRSCALPCASSLSPPCCRRRADSPHSRTTTNTSSSTNRRARPPSLILTTRRSFKQRRRKRASSSGTSF